MSRLKCLSYRHNNKHRLRLPDYWKNQSQTAHSGKNETHWGPTATEYVHLKYADNTKNPKHLYKTITTQAWTFYRNSQNVADIIKKVGLSALKLSKFKLNYPLLCFHNTGEMKEKGWVLS